MSIVKIWVEAMRLRTLPVSAAGVVAAIGLARLSGPVRMAPALLCLLFAILSQIASNFANEYYDFRDGLDRPGRDGPRRGVTEGDISPRAMLAATFMTLGSACASGLALIIWSGWWLIPVGIVIVAGALAYSTGPYPLSRHGLGELTVLFFFGIIPVNLTYRILTGFWSAGAMAGSIAIGLFGAMVLMANNYRDAEADRAVGKRTIAVIFGRRAVAVMYLIAGIAATAILCVLTGEIPGPVTMWTVPASGVLGCSMTVTGFVTLRKNLSGRHCTLVLARTSVCMFLMSLFLFLTAIFHG